MAVETQGRKRPPLRVVCIQHVFYVYHGLEIVGTYWNMADAAFHKIHGFPREGGQA